MNKQNVTLKTHELEVIGHGGMVHEPCQVGEWWVMPVEQYKGTIPPEIMQKWADFKAQNIPVLGYLIADDMREELLRREKASKAIEEQREREAAEQRQRQILEQLRRKEQFDKNVREVAEVTGKVAVGVGTVVVGVVAGLAMLTAGILGAILRFDPVLIAVLPNGRWICIGAWWNEEEV